MGETVSCCSEKPADLITYEMQMTPRQSSNDLQEEPSHNKADQPEEKEVNSNPNEPKKLKLSFKNFKSLHWVDDISTVYEPGRLLGKGTFGEVLECTHRQTGMKVAVKIVQRTRIE